MDTLKPNMYVRTEEGKIFKTDGDKLYLSNDKNAIEGLKEYNIFPALRNVYNIKLFDKKYSAFKDDKVLSRLSSIALK